VASAALPVSAAPHAPTPRAPDEPPARAAVRAYEAEAARHYRWNLAAHLLYGLLGTTGWRLITAPTFIPDYAYRLGGSNLAVGALLFAGGVARFASPLAGAAWVAHRPHVKRTAIVIGSGMRFQVLGMALAALLLRPAANVAAFVLLYVGFNVLNGLQGVVFGVLMAKVIPLARRGRFVGCATSPADRPPPWSPGWRAASYARCHFRRATASRSWSRSPSPRSVSSASRRSASRARPSSTRPARSRR